MGIDSICEQERDRLWCTVLVWAMGEGLITMKVLELILRYFNSKRPDY
jgi:hypothetical protein